MPTLTWRGKDAVLNHHLEVPYRLLKCEGALSAGAPGSGNLIVEGDNLQALKALLPYYKGQVKCIYIDPPYNTGTDERDEGGKRSGWIYNDNVNSVEIREWLGKVVGEESEDLNRHDKWLCMMWPRLQLLKQFLKPDGIIFVSIDDIELANIRTILDEVFGVRNRVGTVVWKNATDNNPTQISSEHEYVLCYARDKPELPSEWKSQNLAVKDRLLALGEQFIRDYPDRETCQAEYSKWFSRNKQFLWPFDRYKYIDDGGIYTGSQSVHNPGKEGYRYDVPHPVTGLPCAQPMMGYRFPPETMERLLAEKRLLFGEDHTKIIELKVYVRDYRAKLSSLFELDGRIGTNEIKDIFPESKRPFDFPKPTELIEELLSFTTSQDDLILDSFAGSGTTGHAVLKLNAADQQSRRFILVEMKGAIARDLTAERVRRVAEGYTNAKGDKVEGLGGGFRFCTLSAPLFDGEGQLSAELTREALAHHLYFTECGEPLPHAVPETGTFIGAFGDRALHLLFHPGKPSLLDRAALQALAPFEGERVVYAEGCSVPDGALAEAGVRFRQIPYEVRG